MNAMLTNVVFKLSVVPGNDKEFFIELAERLYAGPSHGLFNQLPHTEAALKETLASLLEADGRAFIGSVPPSWLDRPDLLQQVEARAEALHAAVLRRCQG